LRIEKSDGWTTKTRGMQKNEKGKNHHRKVGGDKGNAREGKEIQGGAVHRAGVWRETATGKKVKP